MRAAERIDRAHTVPVSTAGTEIIADLGSMVCPARRWLGLPIGSPAAQACRSRSRARRSAGIISWGTPLRLGRV